MKKLVLLFMGLVLLWSFSVAQIISDFNTGISGWEKSGDSGYGIDSLYQAADPLNSSEKCLAIHLTFHDATADTLSNLHGRIEYGSIGNATYLPTNGALYMIYWVYMDSTVSDSLTLTTYTMDNQNWGWNDHKFVAKDIPKNVWYPLPYPLAERAIDNPAVNTANIMFGMQFQPAHPDWNGIIYLKKVLWSGVRPTIISDFNTGITGWEKASDSGYGIDSLYQAADPVTPTEKCLGVHLTFHDATADTTSNLHGRIDFGSIGNATYISLADYQYMTYWVYMDTTVSDSLTLTTYTMDNKNWGWNDHKFVAKDLPKNVWYPLPYPIAQRAVDNPGILTGNSMFGMQFQPAHPDWNGIIYIKKVILCNEKVAAKPASWNACDFEDGKLHNFRVPSNGTGTLSVVPDMKTSNGSNVLQDAINFAQGARKLVVARDSVPMQWNQDSSVTSISLDLYLPTTGKKLPAGGIVTFYVSGGGHDSVAVIDTIGKGISSSGGWTTLTLEKLDSLAALAKFFPAFPKTIGVVISYPNDTCTWSGNIWFDNLVVNGSYSTSQLPTGVKNSAGIIKAFDLYHNYPNPFNPTTSIKYDVVQNSKVQVMVYDILGREVATLVNEHKGVGSYVVEFNASRLTSGVYFIRMIAGSFTKTQKIMLLK